MANPSPSSIPPTEQGSVPAPAPPPPPTHAHQHAPAHHAFPSLPPSRSTTVPTNSADILNLIGATDSVAFLRNVLLPSLDRLLDGEPFQGAKRRQLGEEALACANEKTVYAVDDAEVFRMTAGLVYVVSARLNTLHRTASYNEELLAFAIRVCSLGDSSQLYLIPKRVANFSWGLLRLAQHLNKVPLAVPAIQALIKNACVPDSFSGTYAAYLEACLLSKNFEAARLVLGNVFLEVRIANPSYLDVLTYYHHAGLVSAALKEFDKAKQYFITAVSLPTSTASAIQIASAKRAIICELLDTGKRVTFPRYTSHSVTRAIDKNAQVYVDLAKEYENGRWGAVRDAAKKSEFSNDCNQGLLDQVVKSITKRRILQLRAMYSRMTINDLVARVGPTSRETVETITAILGEMITNGAISAIITPGSTPATSIVSFTDARPDYTTPASFKELGQVTYLASKLDAELTEASKRMGISKEYLKKQAGILEGGKPPHAAMAKSRATMDEYDQLMAAEEVGEKGSMKGPGGNYADMGF